MKSLYAALSLISGDTETKRSPLFSASSLACFCCLTSILNKVIIYGANSGNEVVVNCL